MARGDFVAVAYGGYEVGGKVIPSASPLIKGQKTQKDGQCPSYCLWVKTNSKNWLCMAYGI